MRESKPVLRGSLEKSRVDGAGDHSGAPRFKRDRSTLESGIDPLHQSKSKHE